VGLPLLSVRVFCDSPIVWVSRLSYPFGRCVGHQTPHVLQDWGHIPFFFCQALGRTGDELKKCLWMTGIHGSPRRFAPPTTGAESEGESARAMERETETDRARKSAREREREPARDQSVPGGGACRAGRRHMKRFIAHMIPALDCLQTGA
jgi:hypothetical protein